MSNLNDLIHTNAVNAFHQGERTERNRILEIMSTYQPSACRCETCILLRNIEDEIKGQQK